MSHDATEAVTMKKGTYVKLSTASIPLPTVRIQPQRLDVTLSAMKRGTSFKASSASFLSPTVITQEANNARYFRSCTVLKHVATLLDGVQ